MILRHNGDGGKQEHPGRVEDELGLHHEVEPKVQGCHYLHHTWSHVTGLDYQEAEFGVLETLYHQEIGSGDQEKE